MRGRGLLACGVLALGTIAACGDDDDELDDVGSASTGPGGSAEESSEEQVDVLPESSVDDAPVSPDSSEPATSTPVGTGVPEETSSDDAGSAVDESDDPGVPRPPLLNGDGQSEAYSGIAQLAEFGSQCTGFVLDFGAADDAAHLMTNGHCVALFDATTVLVDSPAPEGAVARFRLFADTPDDVLEVPVVRVVYGSMRATDVAVVELDATRAELDEAGIAAYSLGPPPEPGDAVRVVGIPVTGVPLDEHVLRGGACTAGELVGLVEWEWRWDLALDTDCKGIFGGNSGSPVFAGDDPTTVVGIVNTTTIGATEGGSCFLGQPCEIADGAVEEHENRTYAMPVGDWGACWPVDQFDPEADGCPTERPPIVRVDAPLRAVQTGASWGATISVGETSGGGTDDVAVVTKAGPIATTDCREDDGYEELDAGPLPVAYNEPLPDDEGIYVLCAAAVVDGEPNLSGAGYAVMEVDVTPPVGETELSVIRTDADVSIDPIFAVPERSDFRLKYGPADETDCADEEDYLQYRRIPIRIALDELPVTVCVIAFDDADNRGDPEEFTID